MAKCHWFDKRLWPLRLHGFFTTDVDMNDGLQYSARTRVTYALYLFGFILFQGQHATPEEKGRFGIVHRLGLDK